MSYENYQTLATEMKGNILVVSLNRPEHLNALTSTMMNELEDLWRKLRDDNKTRVVILKGAGERGFCGGVDIKEAPPEDAFAMGANFAYESQTRHGQLQLLMRQIPQPIICCIHGAAAGAGLSFALASDIRIITPNARFSAFYINVGLGGADMSSSYFLPRHIGAGRAYEFLLTGDFMNAEDAMNLGLASRMVEYDQLMDTAMGLAQKIAAKDFLAIRLTKEAIIVNLDVSGLENALRMEDRNQALMIMHNIALGRNPMA